MDNSSVQDLSQDQMETEDFLTIDPDCVYIKIFPTTDNDGDPTFGCCIYNVIKVAESNPILVAVAKGMTEASIKDLDYIIELALDSVRKDDTDQLELSLDKIDCVGEA